MVRVVEYLLAGAKNASGSVLASGTATCRVAGTTTNATVYQDFELTTPHSQPITLDSYGRATVYADRRVDIVLADSAGNVVETVSDTGGISAGDIPGTDLQAATITPTQLASTAFGAVVNGSVSSISAATTISDSDGYGLFLCTAGASGYTVTLPTAIDNTNRVIRFKKVDAAAGLITLDGEGAETINGATTYVLAVKEEAVTLFCTGTAWHILDQYVPVIEVRYESDAAQDTVTATAEVVDYEDVVTDTGTAQIGAAYVTTGSWVFTAPKSGWYEVTAHFQFSSGTNVPGTSYNLHLYTQGARDKTIGNTRVQTSTSMVGDIHGNGRIKVSQGHTISVWVEQDQGVNRASSTSTDFNWIEIRWIGD